MFKALLGHSDMIVASLVIGIIIIIIIPLAPWALDLLLIVNIAISLIVFLTTFFTTNILQLSVFPTLLLVTTLLRLALNISSTRLILSAGEAGAVINAFGSFVIGGNYVVGLVIFIIITVIQFVVITNGAGRVAEVAARFTLDAMPGKQMAVDADLNAGLINDVQARARRRELQRESDFYGAMDGASKFVKGDAIAGIVITLINIFGGLIIGMLQLGMSIQEAAVVYVMLTVGDGLVSQLPALLISSATGILVTRANTDHSFGTELTAQLFSMPKVLGMVAVLLAAIGLVPALPATPFLVVSAGLGYAAYVLFQEASEKEKASVRAVQQAPPRPSEPENVLNFVSTEQLEAEIGFGLVRLTDGSKGGDMLERLAALRRRVISEQGLFIRPIRIRDNLQLQPNHYVFKVRGNQVAEGELLPNHFLAMDYGGGKVDLPGTDTLEPTFGLPARWIASSERERAEMLGLTVVDATTVFITHLSEVVRRYAHELLGRQEVKEMVEKVKEQNPAVIEELAAEHVTVGELQKVLQGLLQEGVPIRDLVTILEAVADNIRVSRDSDILLEKTRQALSRTISQNIAEQGTIYAVTLHPRTEQGMLESVSVSGNGHILLEPAKLGTFFDRLGKQGEKLQAQGKQPVVLCPSRLRLPLRRLTARHFPHFIFIAPGEVTNGISIETIGVVGVE